MVFRTFKSCSVRSSRTNVQQNNLFVCRFARSRGHSCMQMRWLTSTKILVISGLFLRWRSRKGFQSISKFQDMLRILVIGICTTFTYFQTLRPQKHGFLHKTGFSLLHRYYFDGGIEVLQNRKSLNYLKLRQMRWYTYIQNFSNEPGLWHRVPRLVTYATEISLLRSLVALQQ